MSRASDYIIYWEQSGSPEQNEGDKQPYLQSFCIFDKKHYSQVLAPRLLSLKFHYLGYDVTELNANSIRGSNQRLQFATDISNIVDDVNFVLITGLLDKSKMNNATDYASAMLQFGLDHSHRFLQERGQEQGLTYVISADFQDEALSQITQQRFRQACIDNNSLPFELVVSEQQPLGVQFVKLLSEPLIEHQLEPDKDNKIFSSLTDKFYCKGGRKNVGEGYEDWGLKVFT